MNKKYFGELFSGIVIAFIIITAIACAIKFGINNNKSIATLTPEDKRAMTYNLVTDESSKIEGNDFVRFNAYFLNDLDNDGYAEKYDGTCKNIAEKGMLYMDLNVLTEGKLVDGVIEVNGSNFDYGMSMIEDEVLKNDYISDNVKKIELKDINAGTQKLIIGKISSRIGSNINNYSSDSYEENQTENNVINSITFKGTYVPLEGETIEVNKTVKLNVDWYGETRASLFNQLNTVKFDMNGNYELSFEFFIKEENKQLLLKENLNKVKIPELGGYAPVEVKCNNYETEWQYDENTRELTIKRESIVEENGYVRKTLARENSYSVTVRYPRKAYDAITSYEGIKFEIEGYYTGYNNKNDEFENPYKSNVAKGTINYLVDKEPKGEIYNFHVDYVDKAQFPRYNKFGYSFQDVLNAYNKGEIAENKKFTVRWEAVRGDQGVVPSMIMSETKENDNYGDKWNLTIIEDYIENVGIYFKNANNFLGDDGSISVYNNDTNELLKVFTKEDWNIYTASNPYRYDVGIKHIRVETSATNTNSYLNVYNIKELNTEKIMNRFTADEFKEFNTTSTYLTGICNIEGLGEEEKKVSERADFVYDKSNAELILEKKTAISNEKLENEKIIISADFDAKWKNGEFLVEIPDEIVNIQINSVNIQNRNVRVEAYDLVQNDNGKNFIRIVTKNDEPEYYTIGIDCNLTPNPSTATVNRAFRLYAYNEIAHEYILSNQDIYDVNQNNNKTEKVGFSTASMDFIAPTTLITMETVTNYDDTDDSEMTVAPNVALVNKGKSQATINVNLTNNYENQISNIKVIGKIPYENNTYIINGKNLYSEFTTQMTENGIKIPDELQDKTVVFYSEKTTPTTDIENIENAWKTKENVEDWSKIRSYLIYINDYVMPSKKSVRFSYNIVLPQDINLNQASYSTHAVYYNLNTENGIIKLNTEPTKVGVRIVKKYDLELTKFKVNSNITIPGVKYALCYEERTVEGEIEEKQKIISTDNEGIIELRDLLKNYEYTLKEIEVPDTAELSANETKFMVSANDELTINENKKTAEFIDDKLFIELEDEIKVNLIINKTKVGTNIKIDKSYFSITDESGNIDIVYTTNGQAVLNGLSIGKTYTVTEKKAQSNIEINPGTFRFKIVREGNDLQVVVEENTLLKDEYQLINNEEMLNPELTINVEDEIKYSLKIKKQDELGNNIENAEFELIKDDNTKFKMYTSRNGTASAEGLSIGKIYTLKETKAIGYFLDEAKANSITFKVERDGELKITALNVNDGLNLVQDAIVTENGLDAELSLVLENEKIPTYDLKIIKQNEDGDRLSKAYFTLKRLYDNKEFKVKVNDEGEAIFNGLWEHIDGKGVTGEYELVETYAPEGYRLDQTPLRFTATRDSNEDLIFTTISGESIIKVKSETGEKEIETDNQKVVVTIVNKPIFSIYKHGDENVLLPNAKFTITDLNGEPVYGSDGKIVGRQENGMYIIATDGNGRITANLKKGAYKAIEIEAPEGYELPVDEKDRTYYFGIEESAEPISSTNVEQIEWIKEIIPDNGFQSGNRLFIRKNGFITYTPNTPGGYVMVFNDDGQIELEKKYEWLNEYIDKHIKEDDNLGYIITIIKNGGGSIKIDETNTINFDEGIHCVSIYVDENGDYIESKIFDIESNLHISEVDENDNIIMDNGNIFNRDGELIGNNSSDDSNSTTTYGYVQRKWTSSGSMQTHNYVDYYDVILYNNSDEEEWRISKSINNHESGESLDSINVLNDNIFIFGRYYQNYTAEGSFCYICDESGIIKKLELGKKDLSGANYSYDNYKIVNYKYIDESGNCKDNYIIKGSKYLYGIDKDTLEELWIINTGDYIFDIKQSENGEIYLFANTGYYGTAKIILNGNDNTFSDIYGVDYVAKLSSLTKTPEIPEAQEISVTNNLKKYRITTEIAQNEQNQRAGGTITGIYNEDYPETNSIKYVETIKYGNNNMQEIQIQAEEGYVINEITINGESIKKDDSILTTYSFKPGDFEAVKENKHIAVTFSERHNSINIIKKNANDESVEGAKFEIKNKEYDIQLGELTANGKPQQIKDGQTQYQEFLGSIINKNSEYYFEENDGKYTPNNLNGNTTDVAWSCFKIDLTNQEDEYYIEVDLTKGLWSAGPYGPMDNFSVYLSESEDATSGTSLLNGNVSGTKLESSLSGGKVYYLHFRYSKFIQVTTTRTLSINDIRIYKARTVSYNFTENNGVYEPNNSYQINSHSSSYIPLDLRACEGVYEITINAELDAPYQDTKPGYVYVTESTDIPNINSTEGLIAKLNSSTKIQPKDYTVTVEGGKLYYIHMGYVRGAQVKLSTSSVPNDFRINSISVKQIVNKYYVTTNNNGIAGVDINDYGKFVVKEIEAPQGYILSNELQEVTISAEQPNPTITVINEKASKVIVHHYLQGTGEEYNIEPVVLAEEETVIGKSGTRYNTSPNTEIQGYCLIKDTDDKYVLPENAAGVFEAEDQHVYYYYTPAPVKLMVHHYLEGTEDKIVEDEISTYTKGQHYRTSPSEVVLRSYDLVDVHGDEEKDIIQDEEVTYSYTQKQYSITTKVETISYFGKPEKGGEISGEGENPYETVAHGTSNTKTIRMTPNQGFKIDQIVVNQLKDGHVISSEKMDTDFNINDTYDLPQIQNIVNDYEIVVRFVPDMGKVIVHHYIEGTQTSIVPDEVIIDEYGNVIETKPVDDTEYENAENYRRYVLVQSPAEPNIVASREDQEVTYYYNVQYKVTTEVIAHDEIKNGENVHVKGGNISGENDKPYEVVARGNDSNKEITITPKDDYKILEIKINGETFDFADRLADDGTVTLDKFTNMMEDQHITAVFERIYREISAKVIVKYLEEGTNKELKTEDMKEGIVGERYTTTRAAISGYEIAGNEPTNANGIMTEEDTVVIYYYKAIREADQTGNSVKNKITANKARSPKTGDNIMIKTAFGIIAFIILMGVKKKRKSVFIGKHFK